MDVVKKQQFQVILQSIKRNPGGIENDSPELLIDSFFKGAVSIENGFLSNFLQRMNQNVFILVKTMSLSRQMFRPTFEFTIVTLFIT